MQPALPLLPSTPLPKHGRRVRRCSVAAAKRYYYMPNHIPLPRPHAPPAPQHTLPHAHATIAATCSAITPFCDEPPHTHTHLYLCAAAHGSRFWAILLAISFIYWTAHAAMPLCTRRCARTHTLHRVHGVRHPHACTLPRVPACTRALLLSCHSSLVVHAFTPLICLPMPIPFRLPRARRYATTPLQRISARAAYNSAPVPLLNNADHLPGMIPGGDLLPFHHRQPDDLPIPPTSTT